jgi:hypothetical protein
LLYATVTATLAAVKHEAPMIRDLRTPQVSMR